MTNKKDDQKFHEICTHAALNMIMATEEYLNQLEDESDIGMAKFFEGCISQILSILIMNKANKMSNDVKILTLKALHKTIDGMINELEGKQND